MSYGVGNVIVCTDNAPVLFIGDGDAMLLILLMMALSKIDALNIHVYFYV